MTVNNLEQKNNNNNQQQQQKTNHNRNVHKEDDQIAIAQEHAHNNNHENIIEPYGHYNQNREIDTINEESSSQDNTNHSDPNNKNVTQKCHPITRRESMFSFQDLLRKTTSRESLGHHLFRQESINRMFEVDFMNLPGNGNGKVDYSNCDLDADGFAGQMPEEPTEVEKKLAMEGIYGPVGINKSRPISFINSRYSYDPMNNSGTPFPRKSSQNANQKLRIYWKNLFIFFETDAQALDIIYRLVKCVRRHEKNGRNTETISQAGLNEVRDLFDSLRQRWFDNYQKCKGQNTHIPSIPAEIDDGHTFTQVKNRTYTGNTGTNTREINDEMYETAIQNMDGRTLTFISTLDIYQKAENNEYQFPNDQTTRTYVLYLKEIGDLQYQMEIFLTSPGVSQSNTCNFNNLSGTGKNNQNTGVRCSIRVPPTLDEMANIFVDNPNFKDQHQSIKEQEDREAEYIYNKSKMHAQQKSPDMGSPKNHHKMSIKDNRKSWHKRFQNSMNRSSCKPSYKAAGYMQSNNTQKQHPPQNINTNNNTRLSTYSTDFPDQYPTKDQGLTSCYSVLKSKKLQTAPSCQTQNISKITRPTKIALASCKDATVNTVVNSTTSNSMRQGLGRFNSDSDLKNIIIDNTKRYGPNIDINTGKPLSRQVSRKISKRVSAHDIINIEEEMTEEDELQDQGQNQGDSPQNQPIKGVCHSETGVLDTSKEENEIINELQEDAPEKPFKINYQGSRKSCIWVPSRISNKPLILDNNSKKIVTPKGLELPKDALNVNDLKNLATAVEFRQQVGSASPEPCMTNYTNQSDIMTKDSSVHDAERNRNSTGSIINLCANGVENNESTDDRNKKVQSMRVPDKLKMSPHLAALRQKSKSYNEKEVQED